MLRRYINNKNELIINILICIVFSPLLYFFIRYYTGGLFLLLLLPLPLLTTKLRYFFAGFLLSSIATAALTLLIPEPPEPFRFVPFDLWLERLLICVQYGILQLIIYGLKKLIQSNHKKVNL